jgi:hypothetical protein
MEVWLREVEGASVDTEPDLTQSIAQLYQCVKSKIRTVE